MTTTDACRLARALEHVTEKDHFGSDAFYANGRIFATVWHDRKTVNLRLTPDEQRRVALIDGEAFTPIDNAWGRQGWTTVQLAFVDRADFIDALRSAWTLQMSRPPAGTRTVRRATAKRAPLRKRR